ncbi:MAG: hypothetical protein WB588_05115 [Dehalococcoidia bacterium]
MKIVKITLPIILLSLAQIIFLLWYFTDRSLWANLEIAGSTAITLSAVIGTLSGALLGLIIAAISLITQYSSSNSQSSKEIIIREVRNLEDWLRRNDFKNHKKYKELAGTLEELCFICKKIVSGVASEAIYEKSVKAISGIWDAMIDFVSEQESSQEMTIRQTDNCKDTNSVSETENHPSDKAIFKMENSIVHQLDSIVLVVFDAIMRFRISKISIELSELLIIQGYAVGIIILEAFVLMIAFGLHTTSKDLLGDSDKLYWAINLIFGFASQLVALFISIGFYLRLINISSKKKTNK